MVQKCGGLPLAIVVLAGLLSIKKPQEWHVVRDHIWRHLRNNSIHITYLLALSFNDLPYQLKLCFLYLGLFPEDFEINAEEVIRLFVAEGFVVQDEVQTMEDVARDNLHELINRSLLQIEKRYWGRVATCRVHDLLRDLAIQKAKELDFFQIYDQAKHSISSSYKSSCRRQAVYYWIDYSWTKNCPWFRRGNSLLRSLFIFDQQKMWLGNEDDMLKSLCTRFRLLRVLNLEGFNSWSLPEDIGKLIHLKFLGVSKTFMQDLPRSIVKLQSLETLYVYNSMSELEIPSDIFKLKELRHVIGNFKGPLPIDDLTNLQTLKNVEYEKWTKVNTEKLVNLRELHMCRRSGTEEKPLSDCQYLIDLRLEGRIEKFPADMHALLPNLQCLCLMVFELKEDPMPALEKLPKLMFLDLYLKYYSGRKLICTAKGFPRLEILELGSNGSTEEWQVEEGALPMLRGLRVPHSFSFRISGIPGKLRSIPLPRKWNNKDQRDTLWY